MLVEIREARGFCQTLAGVNVNISNIVSRFGLLSLIKNMTKSKYTNIYKKYVVQKSLPSLKSFHKTFSTNTVLKERR